MLDLLWRSRFRWKLNPKRVTGDTAYGTAENIAAVERAGIRAYVPLTGADKAPLLQQRRVRLRPRTGPIPVPGGRDLEAEDLQHRQKPDRLQSRAGHM